MCTVSVSGIQWYLQLRVSVFISGVLTSRENRTAQTHMAWILKTTSCPGTFRTWLGNQAANLSGESFLANDSESLQCCRKGERALDNGKKREAGKCSRSGRVIRSVRLKAQLNMLWTNRELLFVVYHGSRRVEMTPLNVDTRSITNRSVYLESVSLHLPDGPWILDSMSGCFLRLIRFCCCFALLF